ncbi:hypothetical protein EMIHUDRAFT_234416 [Emiliania huxleyi CCMP1516]|uniref:Protein kinase domain-containing protein n=2 Tax=Emiliania huxleyi TaxID=2903 RepID=A0A0D3JZG1_EMIH1|nr:hypothetical protein EMIHUDRAFT_234416 [Emiliania huxleyi CCMP1516]EOD28896.1 hypothetical protein EMIHUDRAFT_234416 [Emiliania huxleyi CCMP1516]|eukprot:XP_005781325.1 hypothetical protein EMIHUDRAFT_234416 [Emiliania huxleyi CCMP1516]
MSLTDLLRATLSRAGSHGSRPVNLQARSTYISGARLLPMGTCLSSQKGRLTSDYVDAVVNKERGSANKPNGPAASSSKMSLGPSASTLGSARSTSGHRDRMSTSNFGSEELSSETTKARGQRPAIEGGGFEEVDDEIASAFAQGSRAQQEGSELKDMELSPADWDLFLAGAKQRRFLQGERVLEEGQPTAALFQILAGELRVELSLKGQPAAVVAGKATASIVTDSDEAIVAIVMILEASYLDKLFEQHPHLPGRFFAFLASYQARRLKQVTEMVASATVEVQGLGGDKVKIADAQCYEPFLRSDHFSYILELKAKEGVVPGLPDFRLLRVLGQGGFGQVLEVVKRDCGKRYAMKVMHKEMMRRCLGSSWRKKIWLEKDLMASLSHPLLVNLHYSFQNQEFLVLVMDLVPAGDLSEFVLTKKRLTPDQVRFVVMETVCVIAYMHQASVLYRDLKPENLLIDEQGHIRLIDMGLAARVTKKSPKRRSRVGTEDGLLHGARGTVPFSHPEYDCPVYRHHEFADSQCEALVKALLDQAPQDGAETGATAEDHKTRLGCGARGVSELLDHPYWRGIEWELVPLKKDFVSPNAVIEEYMENIYLCVSSI